MSCWDGDAACGSHTWNSFLFTLQHLTQASTSTVASMHLISCVCHAVVLEFIVLYNREHGRKTVKNTHTHTLHTLVEVIDKVLLLPLKCITVTAGNCVSRQREPVIIITSTPSISGICDTSPGFHFYPDSALFHLPRAIFTSCLIVQTGG